MTDDISAPVNPQPDASLRLDLVDLSQEELAEAQRLGVPPEAIKTARAVERARRAAKMGFTVEQLTRWEAVIAESAASGRGITQAQWAEATGRDGSGRFVKRP